MKKAEGKHEPKTVLLNWPPSKGQMPDWRGSESVYTVPDVDTQPIKFQWSREDRRERGLIFSTIGGSGTPAEYISSQGRASKMFGRDFDFETCFQLDVSIAHAASLNFQQAVALITGYGEATQTFQMFLDTKTITVDLTYPLTTGLRLKIPPYMVGHDGFRIKRMTIGWVVYAISQAYVMIYKKWQLFHPWGHDLADLVITRFEMEHNGKAYVTVKS